MLIEDIAKILRKSRSLDEYYEKIDCGNNSSLAVAGSARPLLVAANFIEYSRCSLVIVPGHEASKNFANEVANYIGAENVLLYELPVFDDDEPQNATIRYQCLDALINNMHKIIVSSSDSILRKIPSKIKNFVDPCILKSNREYDYDKFLEKLIDFGYKKLDAIDGPGTFSVKGGSIDIYLSNLAYAVRLDFFGDELEEIKRIVMSTGQAINQIKEISIYPVKNILFDDKCIYNAHKKLDKRALSNKQIRQALESLDTKIDFEDLQYFEPFLFNKMQRLSDIIHKKVIIYKNEPRAIIDDMQKFSQDINKKFDGTSFRADSIFLNVSEVDFSNNQNIDYVSIMQQGNSDIPKLKLKRPNSYKNIEELTEILHFYVKMGFWTILCVPNLNARKNISMDVEKSGLSLLNINVFDTIKNLQKDLVNIVDLVMARSFVIPDANIIFFTLHNAGMYSSSFMSNEKNRLNNYFDITKITFPYKPGDYVVHAHYGIALFKKIVKRKMGDSRRDFLQLEYAEGDKLFVPIEQFGRVTKYVGPQGRSPKVTRLGTADWSHVMLKAKRASRKMAFDLVDVYSRREQAKGHAFAKDSVRLRKMEQDFPYIETTDQARAIEDVKQDMQSSRPMDRLICGDVGFGKTEVALRAAFKCVDEKMQVMVLCPTTILAQQHFTTFSNRLDYYKIRTNVLSRFKSKADSKKIIEDFRTGKLDILIGTHRLLSRDVNPKNLGLVIIDEEQRFGVAHKEQLKNFRDSVDVLTLSATPIPRTMQMSCSGVRDMSLILTPPDNRKSVEVHVGEWDIDLVSDAIRRELARNGQIYYISNRIKSIKDATLRVGNAAGEARIGFAHGRMNKNQLETVMEDFSAGLIDVLVSTTIIENGIDNPNTNTLIIEDAQNLGLAQMYQLKGRVGRSVQQAYAYFLFSDKTMLNKNAVQRLSAIDEFSDLGSGMQIAMRDLEIRGAGNFLGTEQSGNISHVGFDLFAQMLKVAVENARKNHSTILNKNSDDIYYAPSISDVVVNIPGSAYIANDDLDDIETKVLWYRRFSNAQSIDEIYALESEFLEKHKEVSDECLNFILKCKIAAICMNIGINIISVVRNKLILEGMTLKYSQVKELKKIDGHYLDRRKKITIPLSKMCQDTKENLFDGIATFLMSYQF